MSVKSAGTAGSRVSGTNVFGSVFWMSAVLSQRHGLDAAVRQRANAQVRRPRSSRIGQASTVSVCLLVMTFLAMRL